MKCPNNNEMSEQRSSGLHKSIANSAVESKNEMPTITRDVYCNSLVVLSGGFGTRLRSVVPDRPKPLARIGHRPFLAFLLERWREQGVCNFIFALHYQADFIIAYLQQEQSSGLLKDCHVKWVVEPEPLGTGGAVAYAVQQCGVAGSFLVANADTWLERGISEVALTGPPALALIQVPNAARFGTVEVNPDGIVQNFAEKRETTEAGWINAGLYHLHSDFFLDWNGKPFSLEQVFFPELVAKGLLRAVPLDMQFIDIGIPEDYKRFCDWAEGGNC